MAYFSEFESVENPTRRTLIYFLGQSERFFRDILRGECELGPTRNLGLFDDHLRALAYELDEDIGRGFAEIRSAIDRLPPDSQVLVNHGLVGKPQRFKLAATAHIESQLLNLGIKRVIKKLLECIDEILNSAKEALDDAFQDQYCVSLMRVSRGETVDLVDGGIGIGWIIGEVKKFIEILLD